MTDSAIILDYDSVLVCRHEHVLMRDFSLRLSQGEFVYLVGPVGSGKSSLLKTIYGELSLPEGRARVFDFDLRKISRRNIQALRRQMGIVFQDFQLLTDRTAYDNLDVVLRALGYKRKAERAERIAEALKAVGLENKGYKYPHELSGGEQQRVAIARAILPRPRLILADEPTANLDPESGLQITELLHRLASEMGTAVLMATHNLRAVDLYPARLIDLRALSSQETTPTQGEPVS